MIPPPPWKECTANNVILSPKDEGSMNWILSAKSRGEIRPFVWTDYAKLRGERFAQNDEQWKQDKQVVG